MLSLPSHPFCDDLARSLKHCAQTKHPCLAFLLYRRVCELGLDLHPPLGSHIFSFLADSGCFPRALQAFQKLDLRDSQSWSSLLIACARHGNPRDALSFYEKIDRDESVILSPQAFVALLKACCAVQDLQRGILLHRKVAHKGFLENDAFIASSLVSMYAKCGSFLSAQQLFDNLLFRNVVTWNALVSGYSGHGLCEEAICCFQAMQHEGVCPNAVTLVCILKACTSTVNLPVGYELHTEVCEKGFSEANIFVGSTLVDMYGSWGFLKTAQEVFDRLSNQDVVSWNALISGYAEHGCSEDVFRNFYRMQHYGTTPTSVTYVSVLKACNNVGMNIMGEEIHYEIVKNGLERDTFVVQALVAMYCKHGYLCDAATVLNELEIQDAIPWTSLISGCLELGYHDKGLSVFEQMQTVGIHLDCVALVCSLKACGSMGASDKGLGIHAEVTKKGLEKGMTIGNTLINMYAECGLLATAQYVFDTLENRGLVSWNSLIAAYAIHGKSEKVFCSLDKMLQQRFVPDEVTVVSVLNTCSHTGMFEDACLIFENLNNVICLNPSFEHYACIVDLLGRAGLVDKTMTLLNEIPAHPDISLYHSVMGACQKWGDRELGRHAFKEALQMDEDDVTAHIYMLNIEFEHETKYQKP